MSNLFKTTNPATEEVLETYEYMSSKEMEDAIESCHEAFLEWKKKLPEERASYIKKVGESLKNHKEELTQLMTNEMGKLLKQSKQEVDLCAQICDWTAENGPENLKDEEKELPNGGKGVITYSPIGVIYGIQPWNFPVYQVVRYAIANLMAGNGVLLKHAANVTGTGLLLEKVFAEAGLPKNLFKVLVIDHDASDNVIKNKRVRGVTLTGSPDAGKVIGEKAGAELKKTVLELGSNDAYVVLKDADIETAVKACVNGRIYNNGETCVAAKRFVIVEEVYEEFRDAYVEKMKSIKAGDPNDKDSKIGPMARKDLREKLHDQVEKSVENGAKVLCGGEIPDQKGYYYPATVLENVASGQPAYDDELFGPVASLIKVKDEEEAFKVANDSRFGLGGGIFTKDESRAFELAKNHFDTGMVFINSFGLAQPNMPFGGVKDSGYGREHGGFGMKEFVNAKAMMSLNS
ncbi:succinate-semialdehyde dehydrogenase/glutarate-semialdehyde dehydrogenase [Mesonia algae]|uniref:Succinate-semialdehyde dehydrogenase/glutarate-semialdehyde dehydrogenase n=1 Tax=Mesonia algae TaxID=213248 RepID=A0A2W7IA71_9FLAO|nr:NAD-dependent succinate-semialdehyde dehydrogenase [Mesonia algae]PZW42422.1 succinate-semialdehyde dehydrogenase/glutarate-semialdehyde dehydrogenase [Mesonia algae]